jgi:hypothetical protein
MASPDDIILDEPERFSEKLDFKKIKSAKNPQKQFLRQMQKRWNRKGGVNMWKYLDKYNLINAIYNSKKVQKVVQGNLDKELVKEFFLKSEEKDKNSQRRLEERRRERGIRTNHHYRNIQREFIKSRKDEPLFLLTIEFNKNFGTRLTRNAIKDKRLRILGRKK